MALLDHDRQVVAYDCGMPTDMQAYDIGERNHWCMCVCKRVYFLEKMFAIQKLFIWSFIAFSDPLLTSHSIKIITYNLIYFVG
jgi:hypothetical protein